MFRFGFLDSSLEEESRKFEKQNETKDEKFEWIVASEVHINLDEITGKYEPTEYEEIKCLPNVLLRLVKPDTVAAKLRAENYEAIAEAESQHSDLITAKYEGGLKVWECTYDLANFFFKQDYSLDKKLVLDLGCGAGIIGILCLLNGSIVHFQDYNDEVIRFATVPNVILNLGREVMNNGKTKFYNGDWKSFVSLLLQNSNNDNEKYDFIFTSETIYNSDNHEKLYNVFKQKLKFGGLGFIAAKSYYFGVGGSLRQFEDLVIKDGVFKTQIVWRSYQGLQREILVLSHCKD